MKKTLESKFKPGMKAKEIVKVCGVSCKPEHYSGRGADVNDLNSKTLEKIYTGIKKIYGESAAKQYVKMVSNIPVITTTDFLINLYRLEQNEWNWHSLMLYNGQGVYVNNKNNSSKFASGIMTMMGAMNNIKERDDTKYIKWKFLRDHGIQDEN